MYANAIHITFTQTYNNKTPWKSFEKCYEFRIVFITHIIINTQTAHKLQFMSNLNMCECVYNRVCEPMFIHEFTRKLNCQTYF